MSKERDAFRTISEVAGELDVQKHVLRFWEAKFPQIRPMKRGGGRRYYRPEDMELLRGIRYLLHAEGYTIKGVQKILREQGVDQVKQFSLVAAQSAAAASEKKRGRKPTRPAASVAPALSAAAKSRSSAAEGPPSGAEASARGAALSGKPLMEALIVELQACRRLLMDEKGEPEAAPGPRRARASSRG